MKYVEINIRGYNKIYKVGNDAIEKKINRQIINLVDLPLLTTRLHTNEYINIFF